MTCATRGWLVVALMWVAYFLNYTDRQLVFSIFPVFRSELGFSDRQLGLTGSIFLWVYALSSPIAGRIGDRVSKRVLVVASLVLWSGATALTGAARSPLAVLGGRALIGVVEALFMPAAVVLTAAAHDPARRSRAVGILSTAQLAGVAMGGWYGGFMAQEGGWRVAFYVLGVAGILYALPYRVFLDRAAVEPPRKISGGSDRPAIVILYRVASYRALCTAFPLFCFSLWLVYTWLPDYLYERFKLTLADAGLTATAITQGATMVGLLLGGFAADRLYQRTKAARFWLLATGLVLSAPSLYLVGHAGSLAVARLATGGFGLGSGLFIANLMVSSFDVVPPTVHASAVGCLNLVGGMVSGLAAFLGGEYRQRLGIANLLSVAALLCLLAALVLAVTIRFWFHRDSEQIPSFPHRGNAKPAN